MAASFKSYIIGFVLSLGLTLAAYFAVVNNVSSALWVITGLAILQFIVQIIFFLHLGKGKDGKLNVTSFVLAFAVMFILIFGSIWIMRNLNYNMTPMEMENYIIHDEGIAH